MIRHALKNSSWMMGEKFITMGVNLLVTLFLARQLGPETFGTLSYLLALVLLIGPLAALGLNALVTRELVEKPEREQEIMATAGGMRWLGALAGTALLVGWSLIDSSLADPETRMALIVLAVAYSLHAFQIVEFYFQAIVAHRYVAMMRVATILVFATLKIWAAFVTQDLTLVAGLFAAEFAVFGLGYVLIYRWKSFGFSFRSFNLNYGWELLRQSFWLILSGIAAIVYLKIDQIMLGSMVGHEEVGIYAVAVRLSEVWYFFATALVASFFPMLLKLRDSDLARYQSRLQALSDSLFGAAVLLAILITFVAHWLVNLLFGEAYAAAAIILMIHIWAGVFVFMRALVSKWLIAERLLKFSLVSQGAGAVVNIAANLVLIPLYAGTGAAVATVISYAVASYFAFWLCSATRPIASIMTQSFLHPLRGILGVWRLLIRRKSLEQKAER